VVKRCPIQNLIEKLAPFRTNGDRMQRRKAVRFAGSSAFASDTASTGSTLTSP